MTDMNVAKIIHEQIGHKAMVMIGAKSFVASDTSLGFKIGHNAGKWTHIRVELTGADLYKMTFFRFWGCDIKAQKEVDGLYFDGLRPAIREATGMATSLERLVR